MDDSDYNITMCGETEAKLLQAHARLIDKFGSKILTERKIVKTGDGYVLYAITTDTSDGMFQAIIREMKVPALSVENATQGEIADLVEHSARSRKSRMSWLSKLFRRNVNQNTEYRRAEFLSVLTASERCAVSNLNQLFYQAVIKEKKGEDAPSISGDQNIIAMLRKLSITDLETLLQAEKEMLLGESAYDRGDGAKAAIHYRRTCELNPYDDMAHVNYSVVLAQQGNLREGIKWLQEAVALNPDNERAKRSLQRMKADLS